MIDPFLSATDMLAALRIRELSAVELLEFHVQRIVRYDGALNAVVVRDFDRARQHALRADNQAAQGKPPPLLGLPMTIKESINVEGLHTCCGMEAARDFVSAHSGRNAERLRQAGAVIFGKTNVPVELADWQAANPVYGRTKNPYDASRTPGGSSGGSAAALAAGLTPLELGSDIGGSIRVPATFCGVFGHRPSETALAKSGQFPFPPAPNPYAILGVQGPMARHASDLRLAMSVLAGADIGEDRAWRLELPEPRHTRLADFRIAAVPLPPWAAIDPEVVAAYQALLESIRATGVEVVEAQPDELGDWRGFFSLYCRMLGAMLGARTPADERARRRQAMAAADHPIAHDLHVGMGASLADAFGWVSEREKHRAHWRSFFEAHDVLLAPSFAQPAFEHIAMDGPALSTEAARTIIIADREVPYLEQLFFPAMPILTGQPATAFPVAPGPSGLPLGLQVIGPYLEDLTPIAFCEALQAEGLSRFVPPADFPAVADERWAGARGE
ncbi:MAG: amidase family protein [Burkholderiaceae bacterium]